PTGAGFLHWPHDRRSRRPGTWRRGAAAGRPASRAGRRTLRPLPQWGPASGEPAHRDPGLGAGPAIRPRLPSAGGGSGPGARGVRGTAAGGPPGAGHRLGRPGGPSVRARGRLRRGDRAAAGGRPGLRVLLHPPGDPGGPQRPACSPRRLPGDLSRPLPRPAGERPGEDAAPGTAAYNLAVVVDDADVGVDQVVRADDLLSSAPRQAYLALLLGLHQPGYAHVPLAVNSAGGRLAKRDGAVTLRDRLARGESAGD